MGLKETVNIFVQLLFDFLTEVFWRMSIPLPISVLKLGHFWLLILYLTAFVVQASNTMSYAAKTNPK